MQFVVSALLMYGWLLNRAGYMESYIYIAVSQYYRMWEIKIIFKDHMRIQISCIRRHGLRKCKYTSKNDC
jgi:hypothetical protein